jgi:hypothetical protein
MGLASEPARARVAQVMAGRKRIWLVLWQDYLSDPDHVAVKWLDAHGRLEAQRTFPGEFPIEVRRYRLRASSR